MIHANLIVIYDENCNRCMVSADIFDTLKNSNKETDTTCCQIEYPTYDGSIHKFITEYILDNDLPLNTVLIKSELLNITSKDTFINNLCNVKKLDSNLTIPTLTNITLLFNPQLYDKLKQLTNEQDILQFVYKKYNIVEGTTIVHLNEILAHRWCKIIDTKPYFQGILNTNNTTVTIVKDTQGILHDNNKSPQDSLTMSENNSIKLFLECSSKPIQQDSIFEYENNNHCLDSTLAVFANENILRKLNTSNGSYIELTSEDKKIKCIANIFSVIQPNNLKNSTLYLSPRLKMKFRNLNEILIKKIDINQEDIPLGTNVMLTKINDSYQNEKLYQNIISLQLKKFFLTTTRILTTGDLIPITFDSTLSKLPENSHEIEIFNKSMKHDALTWFKVAQISDKQSISQETEDAAINTEVNSNIFYLVTPNADLKLISKGIEYEKPFTLNEYDYLSYYNLPPIFQYNPNVFPYADKMINILSTILECIDKSIPLQTAILLHSTSRNTGKGTLVKWICQKFGLNMLNFDCLNLLANATSVDSNSKILGTIKAKISNFLNKTTIPTVVFISHLEELFTKVDPNQDPTAAKLSISFETEFMSIIEEFMIQNNNIIYIFSTNNIDDIPMRIRIKINFEIEINVPSEQERREIFQWYLSDKLLNFDNIGDSTVKFTEGRDIDFTQLAIHSAGLTPLDIKYIIQNTKFQCYNDLISKNDGEEVLLWNNNVVNINIHQLKSAINHARDEFSVSIGAPKIPNVTWDDIGGVDVVKGEIMDTIDMPLRHPDLFSSGSKQRSGILFYGPPGTGKTLMAKAIATNFSLNFFSVKGPELLNMYIGESEANVRRVFQKAREAKPCVIFFDEIDSVAPKRGNQGDSGGVMDRIVSQLLAELDGMSGNGEGVFVIGATNRPDLLDEALLRPGRFDKLLYLGISDTNQKQHNILKALTRKFTLHDNVDLNKIAEACPFNYTGADFYALCSDSMLNAMTRVAKTVDGKVQQYNKERGTHLSIRQWFDKIATKEDITVFVQMEDFLKAQSELVPSVSPEELSHYLQIKNSFES